MANALTRSVRATAVKFSDGDHDLRQITVIATDATPDRMGDVVEPAGARLENYRKNPIVLAQHDVSQPIARCASITSYANQISAVIQFPDQGVNALSDQYLALVRANVLSSVSIGFMPLAWQPIKNGGSRFTDWELYELSIVSIPANPSALVTGKSFLPVSERHTAPEPSPSPAWNGTGIAEGRDFLKSLRARHGLTPAVNPQIAAAAAQFRMLRW